MNRQPRSKYDWNALFAVEEDEPCGLPDRCMGLHAPVYELAQGTDFPTTMRTQSLRTAMRSKGRHKGLSCHTAATEDRLQVQFFKPAGTYGPHPYE